MHGIRKTWSVLAMLASLVAAGCGGGGGGGSKSPPKTYSISGKVTGAAHATVSLGGAAVATATADGSGAYSFGALGAGTYTLTPSSTGYAFAPGSKTVTLGDADLTGQDFAGSAGLHGVAAAGLPIAGGTAHLVDAAGNTATAAVAEDGSFTLDVTGMTPPFLIEVVGTAGGHAAILHSAATLEDMGAGTAVNVTPLTELITAYALGAGPADVFRDAARNLAALTSASLGTAGEQVVVQLGPVLTAMGVSGDPRTTTFAADGTGMDRALDAIKLQPVQDAEGNTNYELTLSTGSTPVVLDPADPPAEAVVTFGDTEQTAFETAADALPEIDLQLQALAAAFQTATPAAATIDPLFDQVGFYHNGLTVTGYQAVLAGNDAYVGMKVGPATIQEVDGGGNVLISFRLSIPGSVPWQEWYWMTKGVDDVWRISGNQQIAATGVNYMARLIGPNDTGLEQFVIFWVSSTQVDPAVSYVVVSGPGIPAEGIKLVPPLPTFPRANFIIAGDTWNWDAFNTVRCGDGMESEMADPGSCALDWSQITSGVTYTYDFYDGTDTLLTSTDRRLIGTPQSDAKWLARKDEVLPQLVLTSANAFTWDNVLGAPFAYGGTETVNWKIPTDPTIVMDFLDVWREYYVANETTNPDARRNEDCWFSLNGVTTTGPRSCTWDDADEPTTWAWVNIGAQDLYGNQLQQQVDPNNPY